MNQLKNMYQVGIYCRLSRDDDTPGESMSIGNQRAMLTDYCCEQGLTVYDIYVDDGVSGLSFNREDFKRLLRDIEVGNVNMVLTKDLSRLGRDYIQMGYYTEIFFPAHGIRYVALSDGYDSNKESNDIAPFMNVLNDMYAKDISRKVKAAKLQRAKRGCFIGAEAPYGYRKYNNHLEIDPEAAGVVRKIFELALSGLGAAAIAAELQRMRILRPRAYKTQNGSERLPKGDGVALSDPYTWHTTTVGAILTNRVYLGELSGHKTEVVNYKTKERRVVPQHQQIIIRNAHEPIISEKIFQEVQIIRSTKLCPAKLHRENLFRGILFCSSCGHPLSIAHRKLKYREDDLYRCMHHFYRPDECPKTHAIYHEALCQFVLSELRGVAKSMRRRHIQSHIAEYGEITEQTPEVLQKTVVRIEIGHVKYKSPLKKVVKIQWRLV